MRTHSLCARQNMYSVKTVIQAHIVIEISKTPVLMRLGSLAGDCPPPKKTITSWQKVSGALEETDTPILNNIPNDIVSTDDIDYAIGAPAPPGVPLEVISPYCSPHFT
ncbi:hypothetical protein EVAR_67192_1 [Eumeta japonica]|uniref:Uncharacterized protein n=1 Tax=Eumeta variegata TaxID=151549 RepID=A0A4C2A2Q0_EUMVA|nr:hypothetical protein EVAR_67192_1 [Eumeta japonica]